MTAYMIARTTITDRTRFEQEFMPAIKPAFEAHGAKLLAQSDNVATIKGDDSIDHLAIAEFPDYARAQACARSAELRAAMSIADGIMSNHAVWLVDGLTMPPVEALEEREPGA